MMDHNQFEWVISGIVFHSVIPLAHNFAFIAHDSCAISRRIALGSWSTIQLLGVLCLIEQRFT